MDTLITVPSKSAIRKSGNIIRTSTNKTEIDEAIKVLSSWRAYHSLPLNAIQKFIKRKIGNKYSSCIIGQRLKRMPSIIGKITRFPQMATERMQDVGGIRIILPTVADVYKVHKILSDSRMKHTLEKDPFDYIQEPKGDGYRSLHQVFKYSRASYPYLEGMRIEVQIRTKLQHCWATAVETLGMIDEESYKTGEGGAKTKRFFKIVSALFSLRENTDKTPCPVIAELRDVPESELIDELKTINEELNVIGKLNSLAVSIKSISSNKSKKSFYYYVLELTVIKDSLATVIISPFGKAYEEQAESYYRAREEDTKDQLNKSILLIRSKNIKDIKKAYPNYFLDTQMFVKILEEIMKKGAVK